METLPRTRFAIVHKVEGANSIDLKVFSIALFKFIVFRRFFKVAINPTNTIFDAKRLIGRKFADSTVQSDMKHWPFKVIDAGSLPKLEVEYKNETKTFTPEEISSMVLTLGMASKTQL